MNGFPGISTPLQPSERLSDRLAELLRERIERGEWRPQERLPTELELAERHGVSRTVVREAVSRLRSMGLLVSRQGSGVFVAALDVGRPLAFDPKVVHSLEGVVQVVEVRRALEGEVAALAAQRADAEDVRRIRAALEAIDDATATGRDGVEEDLLFHRAVAAAARNPHFLRLLGFLEQYQRDAMKVTRANEAMQNLMEQVRQEHHEIADAIAAGDAERARAGAVLHMHRAAHRIEGADASVRAALSTALAVRPEAEAPPPATPTKGQS